MRIEQVVAESFGPFRGEQLDLAPGMTIVHGPNEAGKSSWFAATYAGLSGRRRQRGRGTREQAEFKRRHKPWRGRSWRVGVVLQLDSGRRLRLAHNLDNGQAVLEDVDSGRGLSTGRLEHDGGVDGTRLLGLTRDSARATIFVGQADILRVMEEADALQEYLQRAAASTTVDTTVEEALTWIAERRRVEVGAAHVSGRPLGAATAALDRTRGAADSARDSHDRLQALFVDQAKAREQLATAEEWVAELDSAQQWQAVDELASRVTSAKQLIQKLAAMDDAPSAVDDAVVRRATEVLAAYRDRGAPPAPPEGPDPDELQQQLDALPEAPDGDCRPHDDVVAALEAFREARAHYEAHLRGKPDESGDDLPDADPDELRQHALVLSESRSEIDAETVAELEQRQAAAAESATVHAERVQTHEQAVAAYEAAESEYRAGMERYREDLAQYEREAERAQAAEAVPPPPAASAPTPAAPLPASSGGQRRKVLLGVGALLLIGAAGAAVVSPAAAAVLGVLGAVAVVIGVMSGRQTTTEVPPPVTQATPVAAPRGPSPELAPRPALPEPHDVANPGPAPVPPPPDPEIARLEGRLTAAREAQEAFDERQARLRQTLTERGLPHEADDLRGLAKAIEDATSHERSAAQWTAKTPEMERAVERAGDALRRAVATHDPSLADQVDGLSVLDAWTSYEEACAERAAQTAENARRHDLQDVLAQRQHAEQRHAEAMERYKAAESRLIAVVDELQLPGDRPVDALESWLEQQQILRGEHEELMATAARLEQLLGDQTIDDLAEDMARKEAAAGPRPEFTPDDLDGQIANWSRRREVAAQRVSELGGQIQNLSSTLPSVAAAIEAEAEAERQLESVQSLGDLLEFVQEGLSAAKDQVNADIAPALAAKLRPWLPRVTDGRYTDVQVDPSTLEIQVLDTLGGYRDATVLSHGTTEQIYLLLRLALADLLANEEEQAPLILDDVTVQSDRDRTCAILDLLHEVSRNRQIILFTQEDEVVEWGRAHLGEPDRLHELVVS